MSEGSSYRQILRSSSIIGGASVLNILFGLIRMKFAAVLLGPAGVGVIGLLQSLMATASTVSSLGLHTAGTRQIAEACGRQAPKEVAVARRSLFLGALVLASLGAAVFWALREPLANYVLDDPASVGSVGWLALGVGLTVASGSQGALLNGLRRIGDLAKISVLSALLSSVLGVAALAVWRNEGVVLFVLAAPLASFLLGHVFVARLPRPERYSPSLKELTGQWRTTALLGLAFMTAGLSVTVGHLAVRTLIQRELGAEALGHFQAAWMISMTYIGFVLQAMGTDFYPRLTATISDASATNRLVNEQTEVALLLAAPVLLAMLGLTPWVIELLYSSEFVDAVRVLQWQVLGDVLKVASWPLGFILLASGDGRTFVLTETVAILVFVGLTFVGLPMLGVEAVGLSFLGMYLVYLPLVHWLARKRTGFVWSRGIHFHMLALAGCALIVCISARFSSLSGAALGVILAGVFAIHGINRLTQFVAVDGPLGRIVATGRRALMKIGGVRD